MRYCAYTFLGSGIQGVSRSWVNDSTRLGGFGVKSAGRRSGLHGLEANRNWNLMLSLWVGNVISRSDKIWEHRYPARSVDRVEFAIVLICTK
jgi:hypothetical protein